MRGNLFIKIFIGFWLATIAILGSWMLTTHYFESGPGSDVTDQRPAGPPPSFILRMIYNLQNMEDEEMRAAIARVRADHQVEIYLLNRQAQDLYGREVPPEVAEVARQLRGTRRRAFKATPRGQLLAHEIYRPGQGPLRAVFAFQPPRHKVVGLLGSNLWLRIGLAVLISGLVCIGLSRIMTRRLKELRMASRRLATGDLDTRLQVRERGGDETDELARDFNSMAEQLQQRIQAQKRLLGDVSHELRSPLARLRIALALAEENTDKSGQYLQRIEQEAERLEELISQLLSSQAEAIQLDTHIDLVALLQQLCSDANFEAQAQGKRVVCSQTVGQAIVASSGDLLHKSFENIIRNAVSHTAQDTQVSVRLDPVDDGYLIRIEDHGGGVPPRELDHIFDEFYRVDTARTRESGGYGLGLAIARRAIQRHGGRIQAENTGAGLVMTVTLPAG